MSGTDGIERDRFHTHRLITRAKLPVHEKAVLWTLWDFENSRTGMAWPSVDTIAACAGISPRATSSALRQLAQRGILRTTRRAHQSALRAVDFDALARFAHGAVHTVHPDSHVASSDSHVASSESHHVLRIRRRTEEEKKSEHAHTLLSKRDGKGPKAPDRTESADEFAERIVRMAFGQAARSEDTRHGGAA
jgi:hypothetical protein